MAYKESNKLCQWFQHLQRVLYQNTKDTEGHLQGIYDMVEYVWNMPKGNDGDRQKYSDSYIHRLMTA